MIYLLIYTILLILFMVFFKLYLSKFMKDIKTETSKEISNLDVSSVSERLYELGCSVDQELFDTVEVIMEPIDQIQFYKLPEKGSKYAAGFDIYWSNVNKDLNHDGSVTITPGETLIFGTNLKIMIPIDNFYLDICSRSGMAIKKNLVVVNAPARIDSDYRGELLVGIKNISNNTITIEPQSRIAQCTLHRETNTSFILGTVVDNTDRGDGGLGHSGETKIN